MSRCVLLTGGTGFVGRHILRHLRAENVQLRLVVRPGSVGKIPHRAAGTEETITSRDLFAESADWWANACRDVDTVIHAAWYAEPGIYLNSPNNLDCLAGTLQMAKGAAVARVRRFIGIGTCAEYDSAVGNLSIDTPLRPTTPYAGSKAAACFSLSTFLPSQGTVFAWCRLFYLYGEGEDPRRLVPYLRRQLATGQPADLTSGEQVRDFYDVDLAGRDIVRVALGERQGPFNICSGVGITVREFAEKIADEFGARNLLRFGTRPPNPADPGILVGIPTTI